MIIARIAKDSKIWDVSASTVERIHDSADDGQLPLSVRMDRHRHH